MQFFRKKTVSSSVNAVYNEKKKRLYRRSEDR